MQTEETQMQQAFEEAQAKAQQQEATQPQTQDAEVQAQELLFAVIFIYYIILKNIFCKTM